MRWRDQVSQGALAGARVAVALSLLAELGPASLLLTPTAHQLYVAVAVAVNVADP